MFLSYIDSIINPNKFKLAKPTQILKRINDLESKYKEYTDLQLKEAILSFKEDLRKDSKDVDFKVLNDKLDALLPDVYAIIREASLRVMNQRHRDVQLIAGIVLHQGKIAEQKTGEGKTLTATLPLILNSLTGRGAHLITPNDYLSKHGAGWYGPLFDFLGITVGVIVDDLSYVYDVEYLVPDVIDEYTKHLRPVGRAQAYQADITYGTASSFGFDYLRDNMAKELNRISQQNPNGDYGDHNFAIVDEVDAILIDIARTPLIISGPSTDTAEDYLKFAHLAEGLVEGTDYTKDEKEKFLMLTELGINKIERKLGVENLYEKDFNTVHRIENSLKAKVFFHKNKDYIVRDGEILIIDQNTGRVLSGNRWSRGLHQAIEAKENLKVQAENKTVATISYQNYFRLYRKLSGMTGTASTESEEFYKIYNLDVVVIPTNKKIARVDRPDIVYKTETGKFQAIAKDIQERNKKGQPILIGTISIQKSELISKYLKHLGVKHEILNAKHHDREAQIIRQAGQKGSVTVATNMAGRGVDIILGGDPFDKEKFDEITSLGGLFVVGTERHDSRRIDNQLRGRSGRQGEIGESRFYLSLQDDLVRIFGGSTIESIMTRMGVGDEVPIEAGLISKSIESAQKKVEGINFDMRRRLVEFDDVINIQRESIYRMRRRILFAEFEKREGLYEWLAKKLDPQKFNFEELRIDREKEYGEMVWFQVCRNICLDTIDFLWMDHIDTMDDLKTEVSLRHYGQLDDVVEYKREARILFDALVSEINNTITDRLEKIEVKVEYINEPTNTETSNQFVTNNPDVIESGFKDEAAALLTRANDGSIDFSKAKRNDPCPCGSGRKFKNCHGRNS